MRPVPIAQLERRIPVGGRIRIGTTKKAKSGKDHPAKLDTFRLTSHDKVAIEQVAAVYGGEAQQWKGSPGDGTQWEVVTESDTLRVWLPPGDPLHQAYELWSGGGCQRRCDGDTVQVAQQTSPDGAEMVERPCVCAADGELACKLTTRLSVLLPEVRFAGVWRIDSHGEHAAAELPGMVDMIRHMQGNSATPVAVLALEQRSSGNRRFAVPVLRPDGTVEELARGELTAANRIGTATGAPQIAASAEAGGTTPVELHAAQDATEDVVDAEVIPDARELMDRAKAWTGADESRQQQVAHWLADRGTTKVMDLDVDGLAALDVQLEAWEGGGE